MKKSFFTLALLLASIISVQAQVWLTDVLEPTEKSCVSISKSTGEGVNFCHLLKLKSSIAFWGQQNTAKKYIVYHLDGKYDKMSFWVGANHCTCKRTLVSVLRIKGNDNVLYDEPVRYYDAPHFVELDVKGVNELRIDLVVNDNDVTLAWVQLWKE